MDYNYEALDDKRFQKLCQALMVAQFPNAQCLPVGEPDGGRDAILLPRHPADQNTVVFQVNFSRIPDHKNARNAMSNLVQDKLSKVTSLIAEGVKSYYFITNTKGTSSLERGSIDTVNEFLTTEFEMPCRVWWRDDLDRHLEKFSNIKWSYPEILRGSNLLPFVVTGVDAPARKNFERTLKSYLVSQYTTGIDVRFRQIDLRHKLTDVFVDLPVCHKSPLNDRRSFNFTIKPTDAESYMNQLRYYEFNRIGGESPYAHAGLIGAFLLSMSLDIRTSRIVLEGLPGQGKSTVTQYISQVNRIRLLRRLEETHKIPEHIRYSPIRIPFKLDLRDYAAWLAGHDPFTTEPFANQRIRLDQSLESYLVMHIARFSGDHSVDSNDLTAFLEHSHVVVVLDGFDEVADVAMRTKIVDEVNRAATRLEAHSKSIQIIVTSRSAAFSRSHGFREGEWTHLKLCNLRRSNIIA